MIKRAFNKDAALIEEISGALAKGERRLWWLGQSGFLVVNRGRALVLDPYLSDSLTRKYANTDKPHVRITEPVIAPEALAALGVIDAITSSHNHTDHFDPETLEPLLDANPTATLVLPEANRQQALERLGRRYSSRLAGLDAGAFVTVAGINIHAVAAAHNTVERDEAGRCRFLGYVVRWGGMVLYHSGDTVLHDGLVPALRPFPVDLALLPINGNLPDRRVAGNLDGREAAQLARDVGAQCVIPCHFDMFEFNTATTELFETECNRLGQRYRVLQQGESLGLQ